MTTMRSEAQCSLLSGTYSFLGKSIGPKGGESTSELRFDEKAMGMTMRTIIDPHTVVLTHDRTAGNLSAEIAGTGTDQRFAGMSAKLPLSAVFVCIDGSWMREKIVAGKGGGGRPSEINIRISLRSSLEGLVAEGTTTRSTGTLPRHTAVQEWRVLFEKRNN